MVRTSIVLTEHQRETLRAISKETGLPFSEIIRRAIDAYIQQYRRKK